MISCHSCGCIEKNTAQHQVPSHRVDETKDAVLFVGGVPYATV